MTQNYLLLVFNLLSLVCCAQPGNSFGEYYTSARPGLKYAYNDKTQTHNYSGNWDLDGDGKKDELYFIGNGGAHLYFHLRVKLSSAKTAHDLSSLLIDMPVLGDSAELCGGKAAKMQQFVVADLNSDGLYDVFLDLDNNFAHVPKKWRNKQFRSMHVLLTCKKGRLVMVDHKYR